MTTKTTIITMVVTLLVGIAVGRFTLPSKVVTQVKTVEVVKTVVQKEVAKDDHSITTTTVTKKADGSTITQTVKQANVTIKSDTSLQKDDNKDTEKTKTVTYDTRRLTVSAIAAARAFSGPPTMVYGGVVTYRILGPISVGALGLTDGTIGATLGLSF